MARTLRVVLMKNNSFILLYNYVYLAYYLTEECERNRPEERQIESFQAMIGWSM